EQWRPIAPRPITNPGVSMSYPRIAMPGATWGDRSHFNLCAPFAASQRCRQLVFWVVDWQAYEDFEIAPSAPVDASKYPKAGPLSDGAGGFRGFAGLMDGFPWLDMHIYSYRNAESVFSYTEDVSRLPSGADIDAKRVLNNGRWGWTPDAGSSPQARSVFNGEFGADRNFNGLLDRGPMPTTARMRALTVARFNYYDLRVPFALR
ncbi:MAG: hypothetical protein H0X45_16665, partial [Planctomycetes bacterium]|nr:hypothetical protein [Planctomycetota bacterium]